MFAFFFFILAIAIAVALAPIILGVIGTMLGLLFTFLLWAFAGFPDAAEQYQKRLERDAAVAAPAERDAGEDPMHKLMQWEREDAERNRAYQAKQRQKARQRLLDAQRRTHSAEDEVDHGEP